MADKANGKNLSDKPRAPQPSEDDFNVEADLTKLRRSSYILGIVFAVLIVVFFLLLVVSLTGYFKEQPITPPTLVRIVYTDTDTVPVYSEPHPETNAIYGLNKDARLIEVKRNPGFARVEWGTEAGWVEISLVKTMLDRVTRDKGLATVPLSVSNLITIEGNNDVIVHGMVTNTSTQPLSKIHVLIYFMDSAHEALFTSDQLINPDSPIEPGDSANYDAIGKGLADKTVFLAWEIDNFELAGAPAPAPGASPDAAAQPAPAASPEAAPEVDNQ